MLHVQVFSSKSILAVVILALATAGFTGAAHWRHAARAQQASKPLPILARRVALFQLDHVRAKEAFTKLQSTIGVPINADWPAMTAQQVDGQEWVSCKLQNLTVGEIMEGLTAQLRTYDTTLAADYSVQAETIIVAPDACLKRTVVIYDVSDLLSRMDAEDVRNAVSFRFEPWYWSCSVVRHAQDQWLHFEMGRLFIQQTREGHKKVREMLNALRYANSQGTGAVIKRLQLRRNPSQQMELRVYDVSDLADRFEYRPPGRTDWYAGGSGMGWYLCYGASGPLGTRRGYSSSHCSAGELLIIEDLPDHHDAIRKRLREFRQRPKGPIRIDDISLKQNAS